MKVFGFAGWSGSGKTTLLEQVIPRLVAHGLAVSLIKHAHHDFDVDQPGKDSYRHRQAGCKEVLVSSARRWAIMHELRGEAEPGLTDQIRQMRPCDLLLIEGYKRCPIAKLEVYRAANGRPLLHPADRSIVALVSDVAVATKLPRFDLDDYDGITDFVLGYRGRR